MNYVIWTIHNIFLQSQIKYKLIGEACKTHGGDLYRIEGLPPPPKKNPWNGLYRSGAITTEEGIILKCILMKQLLGTRTEFVLLNVGSSCGLCLSSKVVPCGVRRGTFHIISKLDIMLLYFRIWIRLTC